ncbi:MAG TPA: sugar phosphate isomerase/epimerase family protein [Desulfosporosinus sp.]|nr:sugar phosphate isomerase/epimerase family protein [Desulfosporosinus sp.]
MKLGTMTDGVSEDFGQALSIMQQDGLTQAELQFLWGTEIGNLTDEQNERAKQLLDQYGMEVSVISKHNFMALPVMTTEVDSDIYQKHFNNLKNCIKLAKYFGAKMVRTMTFGKEINIWGYNGADRWMAGNNQAWNKFLCLFEKLVEMAELNDITLVMETGTNAMISSGFLARRLIEDLGTNHLKVLWDPANTLCCADIPWPIAYNEIKDLIGHVHIKDIKVNIPHATVHACPLGQGDMAPYFEKIAASLKKDGYTGSISLESIYRPDGGTYMDGYRAQVDTFIKLFS